MHENFSMKKLKFLIILFIGLLILSCSSSDNNTITESGVLVCGLPTNILVSDITTTSVMVNWQEDTNQQNVNIEYGISGFTIGNGTTIVSSTNPNLIDNLTPNTSYDVYLKTSCDNSEESDFSAVTTFMTACETVFTGDVILATQQEVESFGAGCYTEIDGRLKIGAIESDITSLISLNNLITIQGDLTITSNNLLMSLVGLQNIETINFESLTIEGNDALTSLDGLEGLTHIEFGNISIRLNDNLISLSGLETLFQSQSQFNNLSISSNNSLTNLKLENLSNCNVITIQNNDSLTSLLSLENLITNVVLIISNNDMLNDLCALQNLFTIGSYDNDSVYITDNLFNPTTQSIIDGFCIQ